jgi:hypothetical protein
MVAIAIGMTVLSWTGSQSVTYNLAQGRDDVIILTKARGLGELAVEQGVLAGVTPLRDVASLGSNLPLLIVATLLVFRAAADLWSSTTAPGQPRRKPPSGWATVVWVSGVMLILYRLIALGAGQTDLPVGGCLIVEALVIPTIMAVSDGALLAWVLVELRNAGFDDPGSNLLDSRGAVSLLPGAILACLVAQPARYLATFLLLSLEYLPNSVSLSPVGAWIRWQLSWGLADLQAAALAVAGLAGAVAWSRGALISAVRGYLRLVATQGGRLVAVFGLAGLAAGISAAVCYLAVLSLPAASWVLNAADSYAHYVTLPVGLWTLSALVELGEQSLPEATLIPVENPAPTA